jgi:hypothetical protein
MLFTTEPLPFSQDTPLLAVNRKLRHLGPGYQAETADLIRHITEGKSFILGGFRGCGKTSLLNEICFRINQQPNKVLALGPVSLGRVALKDGVFGWELRDWFLNRSHTFPSQLHRPDAEIPLGSDNWVPFLQREIERCELESVLLLVDDLDAVPAGERDSFLHNVQEFLAGTTDRALLGCAGDLFEDELLYPSLGVAERFVLPSFDADEMEAFFSLVATNLDYQFDLSGRQEIQWWTQSVPYFVQELMLSLSSSSRFSRLSRVPITAGAVAKFVKSNLRLRKFALPLQTLQGSARDDAQELINQLIRHGAVAVDWNHSLIRDLRRWGLVRRDPLDWMVWANPLLASWFQEAGSNGLVRIEEVAGDVEVSREDLIPGTAPAESPSSDQATDISVTPDSQEEAEQRFIFVVDEQTLGELAESLLLSLESQQGDYSVVQVKKYVAEKLINALLVGLGSVSGSMKKGKGKCNGKGKGKWNGKGKGGGVEYDDVDESFQGEPDAEPEDKKSENDPPLSRGTTGRVYSRSRSETKRAENVDATVYAPHQASPGDHFLVLVYAHLPEQAAAVEEEVKTVAPDAKKRFRRTLNQKIKRDTKLTFNLAMPEVEIDEPSQSLIWRGQQDSVQFGVTLPKDAKPKNLVATVVVSEGSVPIGHLKFTLKIVTDSAVVSSSPEPTPAGSLIRYHRAFISYASRDRVEVLKRVQMLNATRIKFFQDLLTLEPGDRWEKLIYEYIDQSDVFFLFWSKAASRSRWVKKEVAYALERKAGKDEAAPEIVPVIIEGPPPAKPAKQLGFLHFNDKFMYFIKGEEGSG